MELEIAKKKLREMESSLLVQRKKCKKLATFIKKELPGLQESMAVLTGKMDAKLQSYFLRDFNT